MEEKIKLLTELREMITSDGDYSEEMSQADLKVTDILHYIEFTDLDVRRGYKVYKMLQKILRERRKVKNRQAVSNLLKTHGISLKNVESVIQKVNKINHPHYTPRIMNELFEGKEF